MRYLLIVVAEQRVLLDNYYQEIRRALKDCDIYKLSSQEQNNIRKYFKHNHIDVSNYDRIIFVLRLKKLMKQIRFVRTIPQLVFLEHDACQNYIKDSKYYTKFSLFYSKLNSRMLVSSNIVTKKLNDEGFDACFQPKGYDPELLKNLNRKRIIQFAFVGSIERSVYSKRRDFLYEVKKHLPLKIFKTNSGEDYAHALNSIQYFVSADIGLHEYMIKNFEAMACGCLVFAYDQGDLENKALGLVDMHNIVLYKSLPDFLSKVEVIRENPDLEKAIAKNGEIFVQENYTWENIAKRIEKLLLPPLKRNNEKSFFSSLNF